jgi:hypothetical protein
MDDRVFAESHHASGDRDTGQLAAASLARKRSLKAVSEDQRRSRLLREVSSVAIVGCIGLAAASLCLFVDEPSGRFLLLFCGDIATVYLVLAAQWGRGDDVRS